MTSDDFGPYRRKLTDKQQIHIWVGQERKDVIAALASRKGCSIAELARRALDRYIKEEHGEGTR